MKLSEIHFKTLPKPCLKLAPNTWKLDVHHVVKCTYNLSPKDSLKMFEEKMGFFLDTFEVYSGATDRGHHLGLVRDPVFLYVSCGFCRFP